MNKRKFNFFDLIVRYSLLLIVIYGGFELFYSIFLPLTKYPTYYFLKSFYPTTMVGDIIYSGRKTIEIVGACIGGGAYYFLLALNLAIPDIKISKRIKFVLYSFFAFFSFNLIRIIVLSVMYINDSPFFDAVHKFLWYFGSTLLVIFIWFYGVKIFNIKQTPFYTDIKRLYQKSLLKN